MNISLPLGIYIGLTLVLFLFLDLLQDTIKKTNNLAVGLVLYFVQILIALITGASILYCIEQIIELLK